MASELNEDNAHLQTTASFFAKVHLRHSSGEGRTLFAEERIQAGDCILRERPIVVASSKEELETRIHQMLVKSPRLLLPLCRVDGRDDLLQLASEVASTFSFEFLDGANMALFLALSVINHACAASSEANCCLSVPFDAGSISQSGDVSLIAVRSIDAGEPLRMPYLCPFAPRGRLEELQRAHQFVCRCSACLAGYPEVLLPRCAGCDIEATSLRRCGGCRSVFYCGASCQKNHRAEHKYFCKSRQEQKSFSSSPSISEQDRAILVRAENEFDELMASSDSAMCMASEALSKRRRFVAETELDSSLSLCQGFLSGLARRLVPSHSFVHYARGNFAKQVLTRLAMRLRLRGKEPGNVGGCGALAAQAREQLAGCLDAALAILPRFQVEVFSLLIDVRDLKYLVSSLKGLAADLDMCGELDEGHITEEGLDETEKWTAEILRAHSDVMLAYGEES